MSQDASELEKLRAEVERQHLMLDEKYPRLASDAESDVEYWRTRGGEHFAAAMGALEELDQLRGNFRELVDAAKQMVEANNAPGSRFTSVEQYDMHRQLCAVLLKVAGVRAAPFVSRSG